MATYKVSTQSQLKSALNSARGGDDIVLKAGNYGSLTLSGKSYASDVTITSESASKPATFTKVFLDKVVNLSFDDVKLDYSGASGSSLPFNVKNSSKITFDNVTFDGQVSSGYGVGTALKIASSSNVTVQNSDIVNFYKGIETWGTTSLKLVNNDIDNISYDGIVLGQSTRGALVQGNEVHMHARSSVEHSDVLQLYNQGSGAPSSSITIRGNLFTSDNGQTHGIYAGNGDAKSTGRLSEYYSNITVENNTIKTGHLLGLAIGETSGASIRNNIVVQSDDFYSKKAVNTPMILIDNDARNINISGNTVLKAPAIANDNWTILGTLANSGGKIVGLGGSTSSATTLSATDSITDSLATATATTLASPSDADQFRFLGTAAGQEKTDAFALDFADGDTIVLNKYAAHTFEDFAGGNVVSNDAAGTYVKVDSIADLQELVTASSAISAKVDGDTLTLDIAQNGGVHHLVMAGLGQEYQSTFDATLF
jgi:hypothetical protein